MYRLILVILLNRSCFVNINVLEYEKIKQKIIVETVASYTRKKLIRKPIYLFFR